MTTKLERRLKIKVGVRGKISGTTEPVSYTHLDVYKRQAYSN